MTDLDRDIDTLLLWIGVDTERHREAIAEDLLPESIGLNNLLREDMDGITEICNHYNKRNPSNSRFYVSRVVMKSLQDLMLYVKDQDRIGLSLGIKESVEQEKFLQDLQEARQRHERKSDIKKNGKALITAEFQTKLKGRSQWERWNIELISTLNGIIGINGTPLSYVIRGNEQPEYDELDDWDKLYISASPLHGAKFTQDSRTVHQIIFRNIAEDSDAYTYVKPNVRLENGRMDYLALCARYDSHSSKETRINEAKKTLQTLQYRNERSMPFERFVDKFQRAVDDLDAGGRPMHNDDVIDLLWPKIINNEIKEFVIALKVDQARNPRGFREILQDIAMEIPKISPSASFKRNVSELTTHQGKYTREGDCPQSGVMTNGKMFIGNYTGQRWFDESVKPHHAEILKARNDGKKSKAPGKSHKKAINSAKRKLKKLKVKVKELKEEKRKIASLTKNLSGQISESDSSSDESNDNAGSAFGGKKSVHKNKRTKSGST